jgi:hypothetical protein
MFTSLNYLLDNIQCNKWPDKIRCHLVVFHCHNPSSCKIKSNYKISERYRIERILQNIFGIWLAYLEDVLLSENIPSFIGPL